MSEETQRRLAEYAAFFEGITPERLGQLDQWFSPDARFKDPFNDVQGLEGIRRVFEHMFATCREPRFLVHDVAEREGIGYVYWDFRADVGPRKRSRKLFIRGVSRVTLATDGRVTSHVDFWDAGKYFYERLPLLGSLLRAVRSRLRV